jgi:myosin heavy subunit
MYSSLDFSGESGAGKTENCKRLQQYLATATQPTAIGTANRGSIGVQHVTAIQHILQCFGNARTMKNANATRFCNVTEFLYRGFV